MGSSGTPARTLNKRPFWESLFRPRRETTKVCHILLQDPKFFQLLLRIDIDLAEQTRAAGCPCGGVHHRSNYPRKPRACLNEARADYSSRFSFCCNLCRKRATAMSVRFLGRRVYLGLAVVLLSARRAGPTATAAKLCDSLQISSLTLARWRSWWIEQFPLTSLWQVGCARFMPPVATDDFPAGLLDRFTGAAQESLMRLLIFLTPLTVGPIKLMEGR